MSYRRRELARQSFGPFALNPYWVRRGLTHVLLSSGYVTRQGYFPYTITGSGVPESLSPTGAAASFGSTYAGNTNSYLSGPAVTVPTTQFRSAFVRVYALSTGGGGLGRVYQDTTGSGATNGIDSCYISSGRLLYLAHAADQTGGASWAPTATLPLNQWVNQSWTHDKSSTANNPVFYVNGQLVASSYVAGASAAYPTSLTSNLAIGNRPSDTARGWDGKIEIAAALFDGYLSPAEHAMLNANPRTVLQPRRRSVFSNPASGTCTTAITATTANAVGSIESKSTSKSEIAAITANAVGSIASTSTGSCSSAIAATTDSAVGNISSLSTCKTAIAATTQSASGTIASVTTPTAILSPVDRGNVLLSSSSVTNGSSLTPTLNIVPRTMVNDWQPGKSLQFHWYGAANNVNTKTPQFKVKCWTSTTHNTSTDIILYATDFPYDLAGGYKPEWSYDGRTWQQFDNALYDADNLHFRFYNNTAFTQDTVYYSTSTPWQESLTGEWLATLPTTYIQETASVIAYGGADYVFGQSVARVNELSEAIDACNLYAFKISSGAGLAPNGQAKRKIVLSAGNHAGEDPGNWALKGCVEFLIGTDAKAITARQWLDFYVYPMLIPAGRRGGHWRSDWEPGHETYDANRHWTDSSMSTIVAFKNAITTDTGGEIAGGMSFHSSFPNPPSLGVYTQPDAEIAAWVTPITTHVGAEFSPITNATTTNMMAWMRSDLGARVAFTPEIDYQTKSFLESHGAGYAKAMSDMAATGYFGPFLSDISATTGAAVGSIASKSTCKTEVAATTQNAVGNIAAGNAGTCSSILAATTANAVGAIESKSTCKTVVATTTVNAVGSVSSVSGSCITQISATTGNAVGSISGYSTCKTAISATLAGVYGSVSSVSGSPPVGISDEDIARIVAAVWGSPLAPTPSSIANAVWAKVLP